MNYGFGNVFRSVPDKIPNELFEDIISGDNIRIERIISYGHTSPASGWYDQNENEWVILLKGEAKIEIENEELIHLLGGSYLNIPSHTKHKVVWTKPDMETIWLAIHYK